MDNYTTNELIEELTKRCKRDAIVTQEVLDELMSEKMELEQVIRDIRRIIIKYDLEKEKGKEKCEQ